MGETLKWIGVTAWNGEFEFEMPANAPIEAVEETATMIASRKGSYLADLMLADAERAANKTGEQHDSRD